MNNNLLNINHKIMMSFNYLSFQTMHNNRDYASLGTIIRRYPVKIMQ